MFAAVLLTFVAGVLGTLAGGILGLRIDPRSSKSLSCLLAFSAGMMISMICFDLMPEALEEAGLTIAVIGCALGVLLLLKFDGVFHHHDQQPDELDDLHHHHHAMETVNNQKLTQLGLMMIASVALHNFPEGMGMIVPLRSGGVSRGKALLLVALSGLPTLIGGIAGVLLGSISPVFIGFTLAFAAGCMLYVTYYEILPQVTLMDSGRRPLVFQLTGFLLGFVLISIMG